MVQANPRSVGFFVVGAIAIVLAVFLVITILQGDPTDGLEENQPSPSPEESSSSRIILPSTLGDQGAAFSGPRA